MHVDLELILTVEYDYMNHYYSMYEGYHICDKCMSYDFDSEMCMLTGQINTVKSCMACKNLNINSQALSLY